ncbi:hypothetical protein MVES1_000024 [Malassezia vespertilionis]|uniref:uncharacterized protein n=1 Tax=Malassezia vespertilionis TaxID=2020962 RepID=UPI0024B1B2FA|nr:uncharacterized protein MVES1_000024 [Malassezia vespertilionis]WFD04701.1 hypothetical protein MVES1_000024 [Malassezia vespertilionis]
MQSNDQVVVNRENQRVTPQIGAANVGQILAGSTTKGQLVSHDSYSHPVRDTCISSSSSVIMEWGSARMKEDMVRIISQWLADEGFGATRLALLEEAGVKLRELDDTMAEHRKLCNYLLEGNWTEVDKLCTKPFLKDHKALLYAVYKQQYLEHIEHREYQKAFTFLTKRLKPLEHYQPHAAEFGDLCYLLSAQSVTDAPSFRSWEGIQPAREALIAEFSPILQQDQLERDAVTTTESTFVHPPEIGSGDMDKRYVPPHRLVSLLHQALAYQVEFARYQKRTVPVVSSLLQDYAGFVVPNRCRKSLYGHSQNVKCVRFVGDDGHHIVSGSGDWAVRVWDTATGACDAVLEGHGSRIWDVDATHDGTHVASASGDSTIKIWNVESKLLQRTLQGGYGDVYTCRFSPDQTHLVSGGYDKLLRLYDISTGTAVRMMPGHDLGISSTVFNPQGNLIVSGAKDTTIRLWDKLSGLSVHTLQGHLGEITSVDMSEDGMQLLTSSKDNSGRLWDMRMLRPLQRFKGNQNTSKNFIRASFLDPSLIASGSEDGLVYLWEKESPNVLQTLEGHGFEAMYTDGAADVPLSPEGAIATGSLPSSHAYYTRKQVVVYSAVWNKVQGILASCADDGTVRLWDWARPPDDDLIAP